MGGESGSQSTDPPPWGTSLPQPGEPAATPAWGTPSAPAWGTPPDATHSPPAPPPSPAPPPTAPAPVDTTGTGEGELPPWGTPPDAAKGWRQRIGVPRSWGGRIWIAAAAAAIAAVSLSATGVLGNDGRTGDPATQSGSARWSTLQVGNCFEDDDPAGTKEDVSLVPCTHPHNREVIALHDLGSGAWPGDTALDSRGQSLCDPSFQAYIGVAAEASSLQESWYAPLADSWSTTDHVLVCVVAPATGQVAGSLQGSNR